MQYCIVAWLSWKSYIEVCWIKSVILFHNSLITSSKELQLTTLLVIWLYNLCSVLIVFLLLCMCSEESIINITFHTFPVQTNWDSGLILVLNIVFFLSRNFNLIFEFRRSLKRKIEQWKLWKIQMQRVQLLKLQQNKKMILLMSKLIIFLLLFKFKFT